MGTNYYWQVNTCPSCGHPEKKYHIGKSSWGWTFTFHALSEYESPTGKPVRSVKDWKNLMRKPGMITDEYGEAYLKKEFWKMVADKKKVSGALNHTTEAGNHDWYKNSPDSTWLDEDGNSFTSGEFS